MSELVLFEKPKITETKYLAQMSFTTFTNLLDKDTPSTEAKQLYSKFKKYIDVVIHSDGVFKAEYHYPENTLKEFGNRMFSNGIQGLPCFIRGFLYEGISTDIDIENAHPKILEYVCKQYNIQTPNLSYYNVNRDLVLKAISPERKTSKDMILASMNSNKIKSKKSDHQLFRNLDREFKEIQKALFKMPEFEILKTTVPRDKIGNMEGCVINRILCSYENRIIQPIISYLQSQGITVIADMFDGCLCEGNLYENTELLTQLSNVVDSIFPNISIKFTYKELETTIILPENFNDSTNEPVQEIDWNRLTDATFAQTLADRYFHNKLVFTGIDKYLEGYFFNGVYWKYIGINNAEIAKGYFKMLYDFYKNELDKCNLLDSKDYEKYLKKIQYLDSSSGREHIISVLKQEHYKSDIIWNNNPNLFAFNDCIFDLEKQEFIEPNPDFFINITTGYSLGDRNSISDHNKTELKQIIRGIFDDDDTFNYTMKVMASFLKQGNQEEKCYFWLGKGRNGKGTISTLLNSAFGNYYGDLNLSYYTEYSKGPDSPNVNLVNVQYSRIINTSEIGEDTLNPDKPVEFRTDKFKRITGTDIISTRGCYSKEETKFRAGKTIIQTNMMPTLIGIEKQENYSLRERVVIIPFPYTFVEESSLDPSKPFLKKGDKTLKEKLDSEQYKKAFIMLLLDTYKNYKNEGLIEPIRVKSEKMKYFNESNKFQGWFSDSIIKSENPTKSMSIDEILLSYQNIVQKATKSKIIQELSDIVGKQSTSIDKSGIRVSKGTYSLIGYEWKPIRVDDVDTDSEESD